MKEGRKPSKWNLFVKKIYHEGKAKDSNYEFKQALVDASKRKSEMGSLKNSNKRKTKKQNLNMAGGKSKKRFSCRSRSRRRKFAG